MKFFFYGIFLGRHVRDGYGITSEPQYATVRDYMTLGGHIVTAHRLRGHGLSLTGIVVDVPEESIPGIDALEAGYKRRTVKTMDGTEVQMYVGKDLDERTDKDGERADRSSKNSDNSPKA